MNVLSWHFVGLSGTVSRGLVVLGLDAGWIWLDVDWTVYVDTVEAGVRTWEMPSRRAPDCNHVCHHHYQRRDHVEHHHEWLDIMETLYNAVVVLVYFSYTCL